MVDRRLVALLRSPQAARSPETMAFVSSLLSRSAMLASWRHDAILALAAAAVASEVPPGVAVYRFVVLVPLVLLLHRTFCSSQTAAIPCRWLTGRQPQRHCVHATLATKMRKTYFLAS